jgi:mxaD protein
MVSSIVFATLVAIPGLGFAAAPVLKVSESVIVHAAPATVWERVKNFDALNTWHPGIAKNELVAGTGNAIGVERRVTLNAGGTVTEKLVGFDAKHHRFRVRILEGALPVSSYTSIFSIKAAGRNRSKVTWSGTFRRKNVGPNPAPTENDSAATAAMSDFYQVGLDNLKKLVGTH